MEYNALIIEDDIDIAHILSLTLTKMKIKTTIVYSGNEALEYLKTHNYDLILLDLMLPHIEGEELLTYIKKHLMSRIIVVSAKTEVEEKVRLLNKGADDYLTKPFNNKELSARVEVQLRNLNQSPPQNLLVWKELSIDKSTRNVYLNKNKIELTNKEYNILCLLMKTPEKPISKQKIYEKIQGLYLGDDNTVNVHVSNIRKKLSTYTNRSYIKTVWGIGFIIE
ncbi:DNA-binding response OmpR family regulator [Staphylococcus hominis]|uniref:response regulator transcription factor n=1 Tax=Staphylococcus TaxID=1279 RepID=UPI00024E1952|nr:MULTISPECIES: response regulator transcription factor [Staphylococcus]EHR87755.1 response regulator receiver domain protein [Staphylococcus hominis VCU122]MCC3711590.1 response regulator transcription factor [Staphylococcus hominis]MCC3714453.1 response regulator transcription factor [Staphylococcus hominis]MCI2853972.1 response regulator transcription factor [Staphylococcus hominis]MCI2865117.1 response regulator transcription factor [Staphylococcus hominis]